MLPQTNNKDSTQSEQIGQNLEGPVSNADTGPYSTVLNSAQINPEDPKKKEKRGLAGIVFVLVLSLIIVSGVIVLILNQQRLSDWWKLRGYRPPGFVTELATQDTMNAYTRHLFYLNRPEILNTVAGFRKYCPENENTIVLGCYHSGQNGIFIYNVPDPTLAGVTEVTAAHEVLHSVYARLSNSERSYVDGLLENYYQHDLRNQTVLAEVKLYQQTEPHDVMDEMNSTFGTEILDLPAPLDKYYDQFFTDRAAIVHYEQQYEGALTTRYNTIASDDSMLTSLQQSITSQESTLQAEYNQITSDHQQLNALLNADETSSYNARVDGYNSEVETYNHAIATLQAEIANYNQLVTARNLIAGQLTTLDKALDTRLSTQQTQ